MKTITTYLLAGLIIAFFSACVDENAYDGEQGLISGGASGSMQSALEQINQAVLINDSALLLEQATKTKEAITSLQNTQNRTTLETVQLQVHTLFELWKRVEAIYVAKKYESSMIDIPAQIDYYNLGNTDIPARLDQIFAGTSPLEGQLYQSATRSMTALEYTFFGNQDIADINMTQRRADAAKIMINYLSDNIQRIADFYAQSSAFVDSSEEAVGIIINQLIDSTYKLKEWRIGDPAGYTQKYKDNPDAKRLEYYKSIRSLESMRAILSAQEAVMLNGLQEIAASNSAQSEASALVNLLKDAIAQIDAFDTPIENAVASTKSRDLYNTIGILQTSYTALINALNFQQDIIEADGD
jgi:predicted lipoprotein